MMKNLFLMLALLVTLAGAACSGNNQNQEAQSAGTATENAAATDSTQQLAYVCPMRCEGSGSNEPGKCKVCGMNLIKNPDHQAHADSTAH